MTKKNFRDTVFYLTSVLDNLPFAAFLKDADGKIINANKKLEELCKIKRKDLLGLRTDDVFAQRLTDYISDGEIIKTKKSFTKEYKLNLANTGEAWYRITKSPILSPCGSVRAIVVFIKNIEQEKITEAYKETFISTLTHDLKTPTIAQIRALELLLGGAFGNLAPAQKEIITQTLESCKYMYSMISDVISAYKYENGDMQLFNKEFDLNLLTRECCIELTNLAGDKGQNLKLTCKSSKPPLIYGDRIQIKHVILNLIANSISYGFCNSEINMTIEDTKDGILFTTNNLSRTIPDDILDTVFDKYVSGAAKFNKVGSGLSLYLSQRIVSAHLGSMVAYSKDNRTSLGFIVPYCKQAKELLLAK